MRQVATSISLSNYLTIEIAGQTGRTNKMKNNLVAQKFIGDIEPEREREREIHVYIQIKTHQLVCSTTKIGRCVTQVVPLRQSGSAGYQLQ